MGDWRDEAACRSPDVDVDLFFSDNDDEIRRAKAVCVFCPVRQPCLELAYRHRIGWYVYGGTSAEDRGFDKEGCRRRVGRGR